MSTSWLTAFVDETGTNELDSSKLGVSNLFICVAVVVDDVGRLETENAMYKLSSELCGGAEISSRRIGGDHKRRLKFLKKMESMPFGYYALVINKDNICENSGLRFKKQFYKYINRMLYRRLDNSGMNMRVLADEIGGRDFMESFESYIEENNSKMLFSDFNMDFFSHRFVKSEEERLIQLADLIAGTLSYCFDADKKNDYSSQFRESLQLKEIGIHCWPLEFVPISGADSKNENEWDDRLRCTCLNRAIRFIEENENKSNIELSMQATALKYLLFSRKFEDREKQAIYSDKLIEKLSTDGYDKLSKQAFSSIVIGKIREAGIILAGTNEGFRLALSTEDIRDYLNHDRSIIEPMINRLIKARETVKCDTANCYDILRESDYECLRKIASAFVDYAIERGAEKKDE